MPPSALTFRPLDATVWVSHHIVAVICLAAFCLWVSISLILRMWIIHRRATFLKKILWSFTLLIPIFGWLCYAGLFRVPNFTDVECPDEHSRDAPCIGNEPF